MPFRKCFTNTFPFDGYDTHNNVCVTLEGETLHCPDVLITTPFHYFITFLGLPSRPSSASFRPHHLWDNLIGGSPDNYHHLGLFKIFPRLTLPVIILLHIVKYLIILPLKIITMPIKLIVNIIKLATEFIPLLLRSIAANALDFALTTLLTREHKSNRNIIVNIIVSIILIVISLLSAGLCLGAFIVHLIGRALTSPLESAKAAFSLPMDLIKISTGFGRAFFYFCAIILAGWSISLSIALWAICLPLALSTAITAIPSLFQFVSWLTQLPVVSTLMSATEFFITAFSLAGIGFPLSLLANFIGLPLSTSVIYLGSVVAACAITLGTLWSSVTEKLSNRWFKNTGSLRTNEIALGYRLGHVSVPSEGAISHDNSESSEQDNLLFDRRRSDAARRAIELRYRSSPQTESAPAEPGRLALQLLQVAAEGEESANAAIFLLGERGMAAADPQNLAQRSTNRDPSSHPSSAQVVYDSIPVAHSVSSLTPVVESYIPPTRAPEYQAPFTGTDSVEPAAAVYQQAQPFEYLPSAANNRNEQ